MGTTIWIIGALIVLISIGSISNTQQKKRVYVLCAALLGGLMVVGGWVYDDHEDAVAKGYSGVSEMETAEAQEAIRQANEERRKGFHCLSAWDGSYAALERFVEERLGDPDSYEHIKTLVSPVSDIGTHNISMQFRARNGFGGMVIGTASAVITQDDCKIVTASIDGN